MRRIHIPLSFAVIISVAQIPALANQDLAKAKNCLGCHALERKVVGPAYKDVAARYASDQNAAQQLAIKIRQGGGGVWGVLKMPSNPQVSEAEALQLARWVLSQ